ncbi:MULTISPECIES: glycosyltransferase family 2 protein [Arcobacteraceae]|uniref:glycosyltransferase family 2 protein n=1 Tax=Arcobacteraceae TaxID=2808963 RepID=UPI000DE89741|nr:glycosyltransferase family 2 protein [Arcobacter sp. CECT 9188]RBQ26585.1 hypothetical protein CRU88_06790 [Arcobacter sp. CECT 9188]
MFKLTVIIPVYNSEKFLPRAINSVLESSIINDIEIIVVDDASNGNCKEIIERYDKNIKYIRHENNEGLFRARLTGIKNASGEYIAHLDADDYVINDIYNKAYEYAKKHEQKVVMFNMQNFNDENKNWINKGEKIYSFKNKTGLDLIKEIFYASTFNWTIHACWNKIIKKSIFNNLIKTFQNIGHLNLSEDLLWSTAIFLELKDVSKISFIDRIGLNYYINSNSITKKYSLKSFIKNIDDIEYCYSEIKKLFKIYKINKSLFLILIKTKIYVLNIQFNRFPLYYLLFKPYSFLKYKFDLAFNKPIYDLLDNLLIEIILQKLYQIPNIKNVYIYGNNQFSEKLCKILEGKNIKIIAQIVTHLPKDSKKQNQIKISAIKNNNIDTIIVASIASFYEIKESLEINNIKVKNLIGVY